MDLCKSQDLETMQSDVSLFKTCQDLVLYLLSGEKVVNAQTNRVSVVPNL